MRQKILFPNVMQNLSRLAETHARSQPRGIISQDNPIFCLRLRDRGEETPGCRFGTRRIPTGQLAFYYTGRTTTTTAARPRGEWVLGTLFSIYVLPDPIGAPSPLSPSRVRGCRIRSDRGSRTNGGFDDPHGGSDARSPRYTTCYSNAELTGEARREIASRPTSPLSVLPQDSAIR